MIEQVAPFRWKCFQVLVVPGENDSNATLRVSLCFGHHCLKMANSDMCPQNAQRFIISDEEYEIFCHRHVFQKSFVPESNAVMKSSYVSILLSPTISGANLLTRSSQIILDEYMRFLNKGVKEPTKSILEVGVPAAFDDVYWDDESFVKRGGEYDWQKEDKKEDPDFDF